MNYCTGSADVTGFEFDSQCSLSRILSDVPPSAPPAAPTPMLSPPSSTPTLSPTGSCNLQYDVNTANCGGEVGTMTLEGCGANRDGTYDMTCDNVRTYLCQDQGAVCDISTLGNMRTVTFMC